MVNGSTAETKHSFPIARAVIKGKSNEELVSLLNEAVRGNAVKWIHLTPRIDKGGYPYYWVGLRNRDMEVQFKLLINGEVEDFVHAYLTGATELPEVKNHYPDPTVSAGAEWLADHMRENTKYSEKVKKTISTAKGRTFVNTTLRFKNGKIYYSEEQADIISFLTSSTAPDEQ